MHLVGIVTADHLKYLQINYKLRSFGHPLLLKTNSPEMLAHFPIEGEKEAQ